jgi:4-diphosphocytidyl-2-C-methyl-D-erythritol kinase
MPSIVPITVNSPAKLNLSLRLLHRRVQDGYTELHSIVGLLNWFDTLTFTPCFNAHSNVPQTVTLPNIQFTCSNPILGSEAPCNNLVYRAIQLFYTTVTLDVLPSQARPHQWEVFLQKNIPFQAGLGGGSSNAASTLRFLNTWHYAQQAIQCFTPEALQALGATLGSDIPLFLTPEPTSLVCMTGRGEHVTALPPQVANSLKAIYCVVVKPKNVAVSTALAFQALHQQQAYSTVTPTVQTAFFTGLMAGTPLWELTHYLVNEFEPIIWQLEPTLKNLTTQLNTIGVFHTLLCGSGSAVAGLVHGKDITLLESLMARTFSSSVYDYQITTFIDYF